jgi:GxxExxY protein
MLIDAPFNETTNAILGAAIEVHRILGPGLLESTYAPSLPQVRVARAQTSIRHSTHHPDRVQGHAASREYRVDLIVEDVVVVELKSVETTLPVHRAQVLSYMKLTNCPAGLLINFNVPRLMDGVKRLVLPGYETQNGGFLS